MTAPAIELFFSAWGDPDPAARLDAIRRSIGDAGTYVDPMTPEPLVGPAAAAEYVGAFTDNVPGATAVIVDSQDRHGTTRATIEFRMPDGAVQYGQYFVEYDDGSGSDPKISRMVGFVGTGTPDPTPS